MPCEDNIIDEVILLDKVKDFKIWQSIIKADGHDKNELTTGKPLIIDLVDNQSNISDITEPS